MNISIPKNTAKRLALTSLIDVIFLLLLFFMLTSTFSRFSDIPFFPAGSGAGATTSQAPLFIKLNEDRLSLNGTTYNINQLATALLDLQNAETTILLLSVSDDVTAQRLVNVMTLIRPLDGFKLQIIH
ncbi:MAG: biopolymer transporter ExbD [Rhizobiaceae bacterium]|nr:biopolymer transporter ExbD [Rhizobiaceae bacterium]